MKKHNLILLTLVILLVSLSGCSGLIDSDQLSISTENLLLDDTHSIGQTFSPNYAGLNAVQIYLSPSIQGNGEIHFSLIEESQGEKVIATIKKPIDEIKTNQFYLFEFPPIKDKNIEDLYLRLTIEGEGALLVSTGDQNSYLDGAIYINDQPITSQMTFRLQYAPVILFWGLIREMIGWVYKLFLSFVVFVIPGLGLINLLWPGVKSFSALERIAISIGVSIAFYPLLLLWTDLIGVHFGAGYVWIPLILSLGYLVWNNRKQIIKRIKSPVIIWIRLRNLSKEANFIQNLTLIIVLLLIFFVRFWVIRNLAGPMWGDSYHHTMISQLLVDNKGLFDSWFPYAELRSFTYHFGFHSVVAVFHWISGESVVNSMLWIGQLLNGLSVFMIYPLILRLDHKNRWGAIFAVLVAGLLLSYPMFYVNWGRYTQLAGQTILPILMIYFHELINQKRTDWKFIGLGSFIVIGLALTHYRVFILGLVYCVVYLLFFIGKRNVIRTLLNLAYLSIISLAGILPWLVNLYGGNLAVYVSTNLSEKFQVGIRPLEFLSQLLPYYPNWIWFAFLLAVLISIIKLKKHWFIFIIWAFLLVLIVNLHWVRLPGDVIIDDLSVLIGFYIPLTVLLGLLFNHVLISFSFLSKISPKLFMIVFLVLSLYGVNLQRTIVNQHMYAYLTNPDKKAISWLKENTPPESKVLVNYEFSYGGAAITGVDGGWWIPLLSQHLTNLPPLLFTNEPGINPDYYSETMEFATSIASADMRSHEAVELLIQKGYKYIFIGQHLLQQPSFAAQDIENNSHFILAYNQDQVKIFEIIQ